MIGSGTQRWWVSEGQSDKWRGRRGTEILKGKKTYCKRGIDRMLHGGRLVVWDGVA